MAAPKGNSNAKGNPGGGRKGRYQKEYALAAEKICKLGATDAELADFFEVTETTINNWKKDHVEFSLALKKGKTLADANIAERLYQRAMGFEHDSEEIKVVSDGQGLGSSIERVPVRKVYPPDTTAAIFWLKNRQPKKWRDKVETGFTDGEGNDVPVQIFQLPDNGRSYQTKDNPPTGGLSDEVPEQCG